MSTQPLDPAEDVAVIAQAIADGTLPPVHEWPIHLTGSPVIEEEP